MKNFDTIFGDVKENAKTAASVVSQQAARIYGASKQRFSAETIKRAIGKKLIDLGKLTYQATTQDVDLSEDIAMTVEEITTLKQELAIVNAHLASIKNQKICPECDNKVPKESLFCNLCGHKFELEPEPAEETAEETAEAAVEEAVADEAAAEELVTPVPEEIVAAAQEAAEEISEDAKAVAGEAKAAAEAAADTLTGAAEE